MSKHSRPNVAFVYVRVSTTHQAASGLSLDAQEASAVTAAEALGYTVEVVREAGRSGKTVTGRPALVETLARLKRGEGAALVVSKVDRLGRDVEDVAGIAKAAERQGWRLVALDLGLDTATPTGALVLAVLAGVAQFERARISERHRDWHAAKAARGITWGVDEGHRPILPPAVRARIRDEHQAGRSASAIARGLEADGIPTARGGKWRQSTVSAVLRSPSLAAV